VTDRRQIHDLLEIMAALRTPGSGCPWDLEQTFATIAPYTIEEAFEVADAIEREDLADLKEELGDLLLQVVYHARLAEEAGAFAFADVVEAIADKMIRRHPHVFGGSGARSAGAAKGTWERIKSAEKASKAAAPSVLDGVPLPLPALTRAVKLQDKAGKVGFDWPSLDPVWAKLEEELAELRIAVAGGRREAIVEEFGDLLFVIANVARHLRIDPEAALRFAHGKFTRRFRAIEAALRARGTTPEDSSLEEMDALWAEAKAKARDRGAD
jgi:MazG family protein